VQYSQEIALLDLPPSIAEVHGGVLRISFLEGSKKDNIKALQQIGGMRGVPQDDDIVLCSEVEESEGDV
jgi:hypothetical protein